MTNRKTIITAALLAVLLAGCAATEQEQRAGTGALIGAGAGALAGQAIGRNTASTVVGAGAGALLGAVVGTATTPQSSQYCRYRRPDGTIYTARC
ncbi:glycine zipper 2TM domain-containing protein [Mesorhizobium sp. IMUNJ 23232]|uniref:glycine zipper 2TM domain-containing protein n=1 Tax=Mesorhizobium sp. IMUNJ 23232 TaxID=3376064 RepID=UPI0037980D02